MVAETVRTGYVEEAWYDAEGVPTDEDLDGNLWPLTAKSDALLRTKVLYTEKKRKQMHDAMVKGLADKRKENNLLRQKALSTFNINDAVERKLGAPDRDLGEVTLEQFNSLTRKELTAFITVRKVKNPLDPIKMTKTKGSVQQASGGGDCLIKIANDVKSEEVIAESPQFEQPTVPKPLEIPPTLKRVDREMRLESWSPDRAWCEKAVKCVMPLSDNRLFRHWMTNLKSLDEESTKLASIVFSRLPHHLHVRCDPKLHNHWVWELFVKRSAKRIATLCILAGQQSKCLMNVQEDDSLLNCNEELFPIITSDAHGTADGCYLARDPNRGRFFRAGASESQKGMVGRWKEHERASRLGSEETKWRAFYRSYPHQTVADTVPDRMGTFQQLEQRMALGFSKADRSMVLSLFNFTVLDQVRLESLAISQYPDASIDWKQLKHIVYMVELFYGLCLAPNHTTTQNPGCEWQLQLYTKNGN